MIFIVEWLATIDLPQNRHRVCVGFFILLKPPIHLAVRKTVRLGQVCKVKIG